MTATLDFVGPDDSAWAAALGRTRHDVYHLPEYARLSRWTDQGDPGAFIYRDTDVTLVWPVLIRPVPQELGAERPWRDATGVYGYGSPVASPQAAPEALTQALKEIGAAGAGMGLVSGFSRLHPLLPLELASLPEGVAIVRSGTTAAMELSLGEEALWASMRKGHRSDIRRLRGKRFRVVWNDWDRLGEFVGMYHETMDRLAASAYYRFPEGYFWHLRDALASHTRFGLVVGPTGSSVAGALFFRCGGIMQYHLSASTTSGRDLGASKLLLWEAAVAGARDGQRILHLGGGYGGGEDSLLRFKLGFATRQDVFSTLRYVMNAEAYRDLCLRAGWRPLETESAPHYFPRYRAAAAGAVPS